MKKNISKILLVLTSYKTAALAYTVGSLFVVVKLEVP